MPGFGNDFETESLPGALPQGRTARRNAITAFMPNSCPAHPLRHAPAPTSAPGLYRYPTERPPHRRFRQDRLSAIGRRRHMWRAFLALGQLRWSPLPAPPESLTFLQGIRTMTTAGDAPDASRMAAHAYAFNADHGGRLLFQRRPATADRSGNGAIQVFTEPAGWRWSRLKSASYRAAMMFKVTRLGEEKVWRGYICENYGAKFTLPDRGPIRRQLPRQSARLQDAGRRLRGQGNALPGTGEVCGSFHLVEIGHSPSTSSPGTAITALQYDLKTFSPVARSCSTIPIRPSSRC